MVRPRKPRFVENEPSSDYFKPRGVPASDLEEVRLSVEELEAVKLVDLKGLKQEEAAERMEVSRATLQRTLAGARGKIADALVAGKALGISGGDYVAAGPVSVRKFRCVSCGASWDEPFGTGIRACETPCRECGAETVVREGGPLAGGRGRRARRQQGRTSERNGEGD